MIVDRDALRLQVWKAVTAAGGTVEEKRIDYATDCIAAIVQPRGAVLLTADEAALAREVCVYLARGVDVWRGAEPQAEDLFALAGKLEVAS